ncbi:MAG TPA: hypothetical protein VNJ01_10065 [Bacteriovoracaceae bacterium]|nr:hypothetical protein [Bacteriovoracaceae bacterium]
MKRHHQLSQTLFTVQFQSPNGQIVSAAYRLYDHPVAKKWLGLMQESLDEAVKYQSHLYGVPFNEKARIMLLLDSTVDFHNEFCSGQGFEEFIPVKLDSPVTLGRLSLLHWYYEQYEGLEKFINVDSARENLLSLNIYIHKLESCMSEDQKSCHIEVLQVDSLKTLPVEESEYYLFSPDDHWGELYLTYGMTGVPTIEAYRAKSHPTPQNEISNNLRMVFYDTFFEDYANLQEWLSGKNLNPRDARIALGYVPLGILENLAQIDREDFIKQFDPQTSFKDFAITRIERSEEERPYETGTYPRVGLPPEYLVLVYDHLAYTENQDSRTNLELLTAPSLHPQRFQNITENSWDTQIEIARDQGKEFVLIIAAGVYVKNLANFTSGVMSEADALKSSGWPAAGVLIDHDNGKYLPYFFEDLVLINLQAWHDCQAPGLGPLFSEATGELENITIYKENHRVTWIGKLEDPEKSQKRTGMFFFGSRLIERATSIGLGVKSFSYELKESYLYSYPRNDLPDSRVQIQKNIDTLLSLKSRVPVLVNPAPMDILRIPGFEPNKLICMARGFRSFHIFKQYAIPASCKLLLIAQTQESLSPILDFTQATTYHDLLFILTFHARNQIPSMYSEAVDQVLRKFREMVLPAFGNSEGQLMDAIERTRAASGVILDPLKEPHGMIKLIDENDRFLIWAEDVYSPLPTSHDFTPREREQLLVSLVKSIGARVSTRVYRYQRTQNFIFKAGPRDVRGFLTDGRASQLPLDEDSWQLLR